MLNFDEERVPFLIESCALIHSGFLESAVKSPHHLYHKLAKKLYIVPNQLTLHGSYHPVSSKQWIEIVKPFQVQGRSVESIKALAMKNLDMLALETGYLNMKKFISFSASFLAQAENDTRISRSLVYAIILSAACYKAEYPEDVMEGVDQIEFFDPTKYSDLCGHQSPRLHKGLFSFCIFQEPEVHFPMPLRYFQLRFDNNIVFSNCGEVTLLNTLLMLTYDFERKRFDSSRLLRGSLSGLEAKLNRKMVDFFIKYPDPNSIRNMKAYKEFAMLISSLDDVSYKIDGKYEITGGFPSFLRVIQLFFGVRTLDEFAVFMSYQTNSMISFYEIIDEKGYGSLFMSINDVEFKIKFEIGHFSFYFLEKKKDKSHEKDIFRNFIHDQANRLVFRNVEFWIPLFLNQFDYFDLSSKNTELFSRYINIPVPENVSDAWNLLFLSTCSVSTSSQSQLVLLISFENRNPGLLDENGWNYVQKVLEDGLETWSDDDIEQVIHHCEMYPARMLEILSLLKADVFFAIMILFSDKKSEKSQQLQNYILNQFDKIPSTIELMQYLSHFPSKFGLQIMLKIDNEEALKYFVIGLQNCECKDTLYAVSNILVDLIFTEDGSKVSKILSYELPQYVEEIVADRLIKEVRDAMANAHHPIELKDAMIEIPNRFILLKIAESGVVDFTSIAASDYVKFVNTIGYSQIVSKELKRVLKIRSDTERLEFFQALIEEDMKLDYNFIKHNGLYMSPFKKIIKPGEISRSQCEKYFSLLKKHTEESGQTLLAIEEIIKRCKSFDFL